MNNIAIEELTKIKLEEYFKHKETKFYKVSKIELIDFCIKLVKVIKEVEDL